MKNTSLCYIEKDGMYLMQHRIKKAVDENKDKWIGIGGKFEEGESPDQCMLREVREETGLTLTSWRCRGIVTFVSDEWGTEYMHLFSSDSFSGTVTQCTEGVNEWIEKEKLLSLPIWEGDKIFLHLLDTDEPFFLLRLEYSGNSLTSAFLNGRRI